MKALFILALIVCCLGCKKALYPTNGETIYRTGKNKRGELLLDRKSSTFTLVKSCQTCHGITGNRIKPGIQFGTMRSNYSTPYTDTLFYRFLDHDLKSDGTKANIGVIWKMSQEDKIDLWNYLNTL